MMRSHAAKKKLRKTWRNIAKNKTQKKIKWREEEKGDMKLEKGPSPTPRGMF